MCSNLGAFGPFKICKIQGGPSSHKCLLWAADPFLLPGPDWSTPNWYWLQGFAGWTHPTEASGQVGVYNQDLRVLQVFGGNTGDSTTVVVSQDLIGLGDHESKGFYNLPVVFQLTGDVCGHPN